jgi:hypothetical protein
MELGNVMTVRQAADRLGLPVQRIRELLNRDELAGERVGPIWMISTGDVERIRQQVRPTGRPLGERLAWAVLRQLEPTLGGREFSNEERGRAARHAKRPFAELAPRMRKRAGTDYLSIDPKRLETILGDTRLVAGGRAAAGFYRAGIPFAGPCELYTRANLSEVIADDYLAVGDRRYPNVILRSISEDNWSFPIDQRIVPACVAALDLVDAHPENLAMAESIWTRTRPQGPSGA